MESEIKNALAALDEVATRLRGVLEKYNQREDELKTEVRFLLSPASTRVVWFRMDPKTAKMFDKEVGLKDEKGAVVSAYDLIYTYCDCIFDPEKATHRFYRECPDCVAYALPRVVLPTFEKWKCKKDKNYRGLRVFDIMFESFKLKEEEA